MTDKKDEPGQGPAKPGDAPRRPYATIDLQATEVGGKDKSERPAASGSAKPAAGPSGLPPPGAGKSDAGRSGLAARLAAARVWSRRATRSNTFLSHVAAGVAGAVLTLVAATLFGLVSGDGTGGRQIAPDIDQRLATLEQTLRQRTTTPGGDVQTKLAQTDTRLKGLEEQTRAIAALSDTQTKLQATLKALEARNSSPEYVNRVAKLETALAALSAGDKSGTQAAALADKLTELEKLINDAAEASKSGSVRADRDLAVLKTDASRLGQRLEALKGEIEERFKGTARSADLASMTAKLAAFEQDLQGFLKGEGERTSNAARVLLTLEIANLKRAMDRGDRYAAELDAVRKVAGTTLNLAPLQRYSLEGAPTLPALTKDFRRVANAAIDAEAEPADASVLDRLVSGARSIVRVRKAGHDPADASTEAVVGRMEAALKDGRLGEVLEQGRKLPPKAALAAEDWLKKVEARHAVDRSIADIETALKSSLGARPAPAPEPKR
jgi:hypothetical protein